VKQQLAILILVFILSLPLKLVAQDSDFGLWTSVGLSKHLKKIELATTAEMRSGFNNFKMSRLSIETEAAFKLNKYLKAGASYQLMDYYDQKYADYQLRNRFGLFVQGKLKTGNFILTLREMYQLTTKDATDRVKANGETDTYTINPETVWRNKLKIKYDIPSFRVTPYISAETWFQLSSGAAAEFTKMRFTAGLEYKINKRNHIDVFGLINHKTDLIPVNSYVSGIGYVFDF
jgi:hypothetical protein